MAGNLPKTQDQFCKIPDAKLAIVASMWHPQCVNRMVSRAESELLTLGVKRDNLVVHRVPGSLEIPYAARVLFANDPSLDAILAFGIILQGITAHDAMVMQSVVHGFTAVTMLYGKPIINEVIGVKDIADAEKRSGDDELNKGYEAAFATSELLAWRKSLSC